MKSKIELLNTPMDKWDILRYNLLNGRYPDLKPFTDKERNDIHKFLGAFSPLLYNEDIDKHFGLINKVKVKTPARKNTPVTNNNTWADSGDTRDDYINTQYKQYIEMLRELELKRGTTVVDMGCAAGRLGIIIGEQYPGLVYKGYEFWKERIESAIKCVKERDYKNVEYHHSDLLDPKVKIDGDVFFFYYPNKDYKLTEQMLQRALDVSKHKNITIVMKDYFMKSFIQDTKLIGKRCGPFQVYYIKKQSSKKKAA